MDQCQESTGQPVVYCVQVKVFNLQGKNHLFVVAPTHKPIAPENCVAVASKTKKNILITVQVRHPLVKVSRQLQGCRMQATSSSLPGAA